MRVAAYVTGASAAAVHVLDDAFQHRVAGVNAPLGPHPRADSMCRLVVDGEQRIVCADASQDGRFSYSSFVEGSEPVRFYVSVPLRAGDGTTIGSLCSWDTAERELDGEQLARLEDLAEEVASRLELTRDALDLRYAASHDALTGVVNRFVLSDRLAHAFARRLRHDIAILVCVIDVDRFKAVNDTYGHDAGDEVLVAVAKRLTACLRPEDTVARLGGDEFAVVAEMKPPAALGARELVGRLKARLAEPVFYAGAARAVGVTVGAAFAEPGDSVREALARADGAMYDSKPRQEPAERR